MHKTVAISGQKRRTIKCRCGAIVDFNKITDVEPWCRHHSRSCYFMRVNFHKITDIVWNLPKIRIPDSIDFRPEDWEARLRSSLLPKSNRSAPPTVESLIGSVGGISILDAVDVLKNSRQVSDVTISTISTRSQSSSAKPKNAVQKGIKLNEMIPAEVKNFLYYFIWLFYLIIIFYNRNYRVVDFATSAPMVVKRQPGK